MTIEGHDCLKRTQFVYVTIPCSFDPFMPWPICYEEENSGKPLIVWRMMPMVIKMSSVKSSNHRKLVQTMNKHLSDIGCGL